MSKERYFMTDEDQDAAVGRLVGRFTAAKKRRAALISESQKAGELLEDSAKNLKGVSFIEAFWDGREAGYARTKQDVALRPYPPVEEASKILAELRSVSAELRDLRKLVKDAGIDLD